MRRYVIALLTGAMLLLPAAAALAGGDSEQTKAEFARLNGEVEALKAKLEAGVTRADFGAACADCHGATPKYPLLGARLGYDTSGHKNNNNSSYANGQGCQKCHTNEGFIDFVKTGKVDEKAFVAYPSQPTCATCHTQHETWDFSLRTVAPVKLVDGSVFDLGAGNLCANCHMSRTTAKSTVKALATKDVRSSWGAHHGPQSDIINGSNAWHFPGREYSSSPHKDVLENGCVECHMALPTGRYALSPAIGGHSFNIAGEVHEAPVVNLVACLSCHKDLKQVPRTELFDIKAKADFDHDGKVEAAQQEVQGLLLLFVNPKGTGYLQTISPVMYKKDAEASFEALSAGWAGTTAGQWTETQVAALYNFKLILEDRSLGVHNLTYTVQVLYDTLKALDPDFDDSLRP
jgi:Fe-S cluster biogenesis protein NfuA